VLRVVLEGLSPNANKNNLALLIHDHTGIGSIAAWKQVARLEAGETVFVSVEADVLPTFLRRMSHNGVRTVEMLVDGTVVE